ncbi:NUDIX hydrolase domain-like protein [Aspergillus ambiguus]|uniref:NUDIX hydrolase n=1 Tax=Aspergillus ambiguus TaxID=176160 RepID=UPI003CCCC988
MASPKSASASLPQSLHSVLLDLLQRPYPHVPNPPNCRKRASVALVLRVRPTFGHRPDPENTVLTLPDDATTEERLDAFFSQPWVEHGDPEVLFIKRASRVGDPWTGHVALPGGKRDPEDADDRDAAIRETSEEVGLDLTTTDYLYVGNLPERVVTTSWGSIPLMVLCPFLFLSTRSDSPTLNLQPTEVASTHWVPLRALLSPSMRTVEHVDMSQRFRNMGGFLIRLALRSVMGFMQFSAIELSPTESLQSNSTPGLIPEHAPTPSLFNRWKAWCLSNQADSNNRNRPLLLWGLTLGILADFLDMLPPHTAVDLWKYPTFTTPDLRLIASLLTYRLRQHNKLQVKSGARPSNTAVDSQTAALPVTEATAIKDDCNEVGIGGLGVGRYYGPSDRSPEGTRYAVGIMLRGYYAKLRTAIYIFVAWRMVLGAAGTIYLWRLLRQKGVIERIFRLLR